MTRLPDLTMWQHSGSRARMRRRRPGPGIRSTPVWTLTMRMWHRSETHARVTIGEMLYWWGYQ